MKVLSIKEPFASLISNGIKKIETRSWKTNYRGEIYIHASLKKINFKDERTQTLIKLLPANYDLKYGMIICKAKLIDCVYMDKDFVCEIKKDETESLCGRYEEGRYAWVLGEIEPLKNEIPAKGMLGIWNFNQEE